MNPPEPQPPSSPGRRVARHALYVVPILFAIWAFDDLITLDRSVGWERNAVHHGLYRIEKARRDKRRPTVVLLGSSTSVDWIWGPQARVAGIPRARILDAHINGCHQGCTWAEVRRLIAEHRDTLLREGERAWSPRFEQAFYGANLFQMCEEPHSKRVLQHRLLVPTADIPALFDLYLHGRDPLRMMGRFIGMELSGAYADTAVLRRNLNYLLVHDELFEPYKKRRLKPHRWYREDAPPRADRRSQLKWCGYEPEDVALKTAMLEALLDELATLAGHTWLMMLPDRSLEFVEHDPEIARAWTSHRTLFRQLADARDHVTLIDLSEGGPRRHVHFRDAIHVRSAYFRLQRDLFETRYRAQRGARR